MNTIFFGLSLFWAYWLFIEFGLRTSESSDMAAAWSVLGSMRFGVVPLMLHFLLLYSGRTKTPTPLPLHFALYIPVFVITGMEAIGILSWYEPIRYGSGWVVDRKNMVLTGLLFGWIATLFVLMFLTAVFTSGISRDLYAKRPRGFIPLTALIAVNGIATWILDPLTLKFSGLFTANGPVATAVFAYFIYKYNLYTISPVTAAEDIFAAIPEALFITTPEGSIIKVNAKAESLTGYGAGDFVSMHIDRLFAEGFAKNIFCKAVSSELNSWSHEAMLLPKDGKEIPVVVNTSLIRKTKKNIPVAMVVSCRDSSFEKMALDEFRKTEQLEALGFLAGGIAHDFNNLLTSIVAYLSLVRSTEEISDSVKEKLDKVDAAAHMVINLNRQLATISKGSKPNKERCSVKEIIEGSVQLALSGSAVECHVDIPEDLYSIEADPGQLNQVFLNLLVNARQAMPRGGVVGVICRNITIDEAKWIEVSVSDQGSGIEADNIDDIFKPFFTTKEQGTGLGLSVVKSVVEKHGGTVTVSTRKNIGTTFFVRLPCGEGCETDLKKNRVSDSVFSDKLKGKILVMDDEEGVKRAITMLLSEKGHLVIGVDHGAAAISEYLRHRAEGAPFDLLILDVTIRNGYGAQEVIRRLHEIDAGVQAIVMSGYRENILMKNYKSFGFVDVIPKPFDSHQIYRAVNNILMKKYAQPA